MLFRTVVVSLLAASLSTAFASPIPDQISEQSLSARGFADADLAESPFEKRSPSPISIDGEVNELAERGFGDDEALELYIRDLVGADAGLERRSRASDARYVNTWVNVLKSLYTKPKKHPRRSDGELERRSRASDARYVNTWVNVLKAIYTKPKKHPRRSDEDLERRSRASDARYVNTWVNVLKALYTKPKKHPRREISESDLNRRDFAPEAEIELTERDFDDSGASELFERDEFEPDFEIFERDFEPEFEMELF